MSGDELMTDAELDAWLKKANDDLIASLERHIDKEAGLREILRRAQLPAARPTPRGTRVRLLVRAYWRDALCVAVIILGVTWLALMALDVRIGWFS